MTIMRTYDKHIFRTKSDHEIVHARGAGAAGATYHIYWGFEERGAIGENFTEENFEPTRLMCCCGNRKNRYSRRGGENVEAEYKHACDI